MVPVSLAMVPTVPFLGFYLPPLLVWGAAALAPFLILRWMIGRLGLYRLIWHRALFDLSLYLALVGVVNFWGR